MSVSDNRGIKSFTLVELLIVIAILAILSAAVVIVLNPAELLAQARDSQRVSDLKNIKKSIDLFVVDNPTVSLGTAQRVYISLPDTASNCPNLTSSLPALPSGWQYVCTTQANLRNTNGTGWIPVNFGNVFGGSPIPYLPIDPSNDLASGRYYTYVMGGSYELTALMEAVKENVSVNDGGSLPGVFQVGTHIDLTPPTRDRGLVGYWTFDGIGSVANNQTSYFQDSSGKGNNGTAFNANSTGLTFAAGQVGNAIQLDGVDDYVDMGNGSSLNITNSITISMWVYTIGASTQYIIAKNSTSPSDIQYAIYTGSSSLITYLNGGNVGSSGSVTMLNQWHHIVLVWNKVDARYYIDGSLSGSPAVFSTTLTPSSSTINIGRRKVSDYYFNGLIDDVRIYDRPLSVSEIKAIYEATK